MGNQGVNSTEWRRLRAEVLASSNVCAICAQPIDMTLSGRHPLGPTVNHKVSRKNGGLAIRSNLEPAHNRCNASIGAEKHGFVSTRDW